MLVTSFGVPRHLQLWIGSQKAFDTLVAADGAVHKISVAAIDWPAGPQRVSIVVPEGSSSPASVGKGSDQRQLSLGFALIKVGDDGS